MNGLDLSSSLLLLLIEDPKAKIIRIMHIIEPESHFRIALPPLPCHPAPPPPPSLPTPHRPSSPALPSRTAAASFPSHPASPPPPHPSALPPPPLPPPCTAAASSSPPRVAASSPTPISLPSAPTGAGGGGRHRSRAAARSRAQMRRRPYSSPHRPPWRARDPGRRRRRGVGVGGAGHGEGRAWGRESSGVGAQEGGDGERRAPTAPMEAFSEAAFVHLLNRACDDRYLFADKDGCGVSLDPRRTLLNTVWAVEHAPSARVRLHGAYGFYLSESAATVTQDVFDELPAGAILWQPITVGDDVVMLRAAPRSGCSAPAPVGSRCGKAPSPSTRRRTSAAGCCGGSTVVSWFRCQHRDVGTRDIRYAEGAEEDGSVGGDDAWRATQYHDRSVMMLRRELAQQLQVPLHPLLIICAKAGRHGALTPLLIDLPRGSRPMDFVMVRIYTRVADSFRYPNCDA